MQGVAGAWPPPSAAARASLHCAGSQKRWFSYDPEIRHAREKQQSTSHPDQASHFPHSRNGSVRMLLAQGQASRSSWKGGGCPSLPGSRSTCTKYSAASAATQACDHSNAGS